MLTNTLLLLSAPDYWLPPMRKGSGTSFYWLLHYMQFSPILHCQRFQAAATHTNRQKKVPAVIKEKQLSLRNSFTSLVLLRHNPYPTQFAF